MGSRAWNTFDREVSLQRTVEPVLACAEKPDVQALLLNLFEMGKGSKEQQFKTQMTAGSLGIDRNGLCRVL